MNFVLAGPTGIGKSSLSIEIAGEVFAGNMEIISADSVQVYKYLDIGTGKLSESEKNGIAHHLIDIVDPDYHFEVNEFIQRSLNHIEKIKKNKRVPFFVGGTGLYLSSLFEGLSKIPAIEPGIREKIIFEIEKDGIEKSYKRLCSIDGKSSKKININDKQRIVRALEVYDSTGNPISYYWNNKRQFIEDKTVIIALNDDRNAIYNRINNRVDKMIENGFLREVENILEMGYSSNCRSLNSIGYAEIINYLKGDFKLDETIELIKKHTRKYAKKQLTWLKKMKNVEWFKSDDAGSVLKFLKNIKKGEKYL